jgi:hypothetical protein
MGDSPAIHNILYPRKGARDDEIERLDGVVLQAGPIILHRCRYVLTSLGPPEYELRHAMQMCSCVTYRWLMTPNG